MSWILVIIIFNRSSISQQHIEFANKELCEQAEKRGREMTIGSLIAPISDVRITFVGVFCAGVFRSVYLSTYTPTHRPSHIREVNGEYPKILRSESLARNI